ncbi:MAG TPA: DUF4394 domain-containing protein [Solimonas sp.]
MIDRIRYMRSGALALSLTLGLAACGDERTGVTPPPPTPGDTVALTSTNRLVTFDLGEREVRTEVAVSGLQSGEMLLGLDRRPADGALIALGSSGRVYQLDASTGAATEKSVLNLAGGGVVTLSGANFGVDFNPVPDRLRVVSDSGQNLRINVDNGSTIVDGDLTLAGAALSGVTAAAYTNSFAAACRTTLYYIDTATDRLLSASDPNAGTAVAVGNLGLDVAAVAAFDVRTDASGANTALAALTVGSNVSVYSINLATGAATALGSVNGLTGGETLRGVALPLPAAAPAQVRGELLGVTESNKLVSFNRGAPAKLCTSTAIAVDSGESVVGIDVRPSTGALHALVKGASNSGRLLTLNPDTAAITASATLSEQLNGNDFGMDFNPTGPVALRIVSDTGQNLRVTDIATGATTVDGALNGAGTGASAAAYTNSVPGTGTTSLLVIDAANDRLLLQNPPNNGVLIDIGALGVDVTGLNGFDIDGRDNTALIAVSATGATQSTLHTLNVVTGEASASLGTIGGGERLRGLALGTAPTTTVFGVTDANALVTVSLADPSVVTTVGPVTGLVGEDLVGIDFRPADGLLYGVGSAGGLYRISTSNASAVRVALSADASDTTAPYDGLDGADFGVDFNPMPASVPLRIVSDARQNLRVANVATGATFTDGVLARAANPIALSAVAYTNSFAPNPASTVLYGLDAAGDRLVAVTPPNNGIVRIIGATGSDVTPNSTMEIVGPSTALAVFDTVGTKVLFNVDLATGTSTAVGAIAAADPILGLAAAPSATAPAAGSAVVAVSGSNLVTFARNAPGTLTSTVALSGVTGDVVGIDFRTDGVLWLLSNEAGVGRLYTVDTVTGAATLASTLAAEPTDASNPYAGLSGTSFGVDFNPVPASVPLRIISNTGQNLRVGTPATGATFTDGDIGEPTPTVTAAAYNNSFRRAAGDTRLTALFVIDTATSSVLLQNPPNDGTLTAVGALSASESYTGVNGFDIAGGANGLALAALQRVSGSPATAETSSRLYRINLFTGAATEIGPIGGAPLRGLAIRLE